MTTYQITDGIATDTISHTYASEAARTFVFRFEPVSGTTLTLTDTTDGQQLRFKATYRQNLKALKIQRVA